MSKPPSTPAPNPRVRVKTVYEDEHVLVVEKPPGMVTHPGVGHEHDTLLNGLFATHASTLAAMGDRHDWGLVQRLDKETSGLIAVTLSVAAYENLRAQFEARRVRKFYYAVCARPPRTDKGVIKRAIVEDTKRTGKYTSVKTAKIATNAHPRSRAAVTAYRVLASNHLGCLIEARPVTGRLHQVRVHLKSVGAPLLGDPVYAPRSLQQAAVRVPLHAHRLEFDHPVTGKPLRFDSAVPKDMRKLLERLGLPRIDELEAQAAADAE